MEHVRHGGALDRAVATYGGVKSDWLDLSTGINPNPYPVPNIPDEIWHRLPDEGALESCLNAARNYYAVPPAHQIIATPGTQALIQALPAVIEAKKCWIVGPTYNEYERVLSHNSEVTIAPELPTSADDVDLLVVGLPNNPDGKLFDLDRLSDLGRRMKARGGMVLIDAAFGDVLSAAQRDSLAICCGEGVVVFRSFGKFFGLAGLRLGFAFGDKAILKSFRSALGPWAVSGPALLVGTVAMQDTDWVKSNRSRLGKMRSALEKVLVSSKLNLIGSTDLFVTTSSIESATLAKQLAKKQILVRSFETNSDWIRFGLPADTDELSRLEKALAHIC